MSEKKSEQVKGNIRETIRDATDNGDLKAEDRGDGTSGKVKEVIDDAKDKTNSLIDRVKGDKS